MMYVYARLTYAAHVAEETKLDVISPGFLEISISMSIRLLAWGKMRENDVLIHDLISDNICMQWCSRELCLDLPCVIFSMLNIFEAFDILTRWPMGDMGWIWNCTHRIHVTVWVLMNICCEIVLKWIAKNTRVSSDKSLLVQLMTWCCQTTSHDLRQCPSRSMLSYHVTSLQWVTKTICTSLMS